MNLAEEGLRVDRQKGGQLEVHLRQADWTLREQRCERHCNISSQ